MFYKTIKSNHLLNTVDMRNALLLVVLVVLVSYVSAQANCTVLYTAWGDCLTQNIINGNCDGTTWCVPCQADFVTAANCTCDQTDAPFGKTSCDPLCVKATLCYAMASYNSTMEGTCTNDETAYTNCLTSAHLTRLHSTVHDMIYVATGARPIRIRQLAR